MNRYSLILFIAILVSCSPKREVADVWNYIQDRPDSALAVLNSLDVASYNGRTLAEFRLLKAMALDKNYIDVASDSLARPAAEYFHQHGPIEKEMMALYYCGIAQYYSRDYSHAIISLTQANEISKGCKNKRYEALSCTALSHIYYGDRNYHDAVAMAENGIKCFSSLPDSSHQVKWASVNLADCYIALHHYEKVINVYDSLIRNNPTDTVFLKKALFPYAWSIYLSDRGRVHESVDLFEKAIYSYKTHPNMYQYHHYGEMLLAQGRVKEAEHILSVLSKRDAPIELVKDLEYKLQKNAKNYQKALETYESLLNRQNEVAIEVMTQSLVRNQRDFLFLAKENAEDRLQWERHINVLIVIVFLLSALAVAILVGVWRKRIIDGHERLISSVEEAREELGKIVSQNKALENELEDARRKYVAAYKKQFQNITSLVEYYHSTSARKDGRDLVYKQVMELSTTVGKDRESMKALERSVNVALDNAMKHYREAFPNKDNNHYNLVCYLMAGFQGSLIEMLTGLPRNTVYSKKRRLLEKIKDSDCTHRDLFIRALL